MKDAVICGDNIKVMQGMAAGSVDLCVADPPYMTGRDWTDASGVVQFSDKFAGMDAYAAFMRPVMNECQRVLKPAGSLYLHVDEIAVHYLKVMLDEIFGAANFRRHIVWAQHSVGGFKGEANNWVRACDHILYYVKGTDFAFNKEYGPLSKSSVQRYNKTCPETGRKYMVEPRSNKTKDDEGRRINWLDESKGVPLGSVWSDIRYLKSGSSERTGYPTQKPLKLLERIVKASSNEGDVVLDPFCGSGTALVAAKNLGRHYVGIDVNETAVNLANERLAALDGRPSSMLVEEA